MVRAHGRRAGISSVEEIESESLNTNDTRTKTIGGGNLHYAADSDGADPDTRLDAALSAATNGDIVYLENSQYNADRTVSTAVALRGSGVRRSDGAVLDGAEWTLSARVIVEGVYLSSTTGPKITASNQRCSIRNVTDFGDGVVISGDQCDVIGGFNINVTFASGTSGGLADSITFGSVTDNGTNTVGDIS